MTGLADVMDLKIPFKCARDWAFWGGVGEKKVDGPANEGTEYN